MRNYGKISPFFWLKGSGKRLRGDALGQAVAFYLSTCPAANIVGVFFVSLATIASETGHSPESVREALGRVAQAGYAFYDLEAELVWIPNHAQFEIGKKMKAGDKRRGKVLHDLAQVTGHHFVDDFLSRYGDAYCISADDLGPPEDAPSKGHLESAEGASAIPGPLSTNTNTNLQTSTRGHPPSATSPESERVPDMTPSNVRPLATLPDPLSKPPDWWADTVKAISENILGRSEALQAAECWLAYAGHRAEKRKPANRNDACTWLTTVMVPKARERLRDERREQERDGRVQGNNPARYREIKPGDLPREPTPEEFLETKRLAASMGDIFANDAVEPTGTDE